MSAITAAPRARPAARRATTTSRAARPAPTRTPARPLRPVPAKPRLRVVDAAAIRRRRRVRLGLWVFALFGTASLLTVVAFHVLLAQGQLELDRVEGQIREQQELYPRRRLEVAQASSPEAIVSKAKAGGMVEATGAPAVVGVPAAPEAPEASNATSTTADHERVKSHLGLSP